MPARFLTIWFPRLCTDWLSTQRSSLANIPFVLAAPQHGRMIITAANRAAQEAGASTGMAVADARAVIHSLEVINDRPGLAKEILEKIAHSCIRYTPCSAIDPPDGLLLDITGCAHLWGGEKIYLSQIINRFKKNGYQARGAIADTIGAAWAVARFGKVSPIVEPGAQLQALVPLTPAALRLEPATIQRLQKFGLYQLQHFIHMPRSALRRRFGDTLLQRIDQALGIVEEHIQPIQPVIIYQERLPCLEPIVTAVGIEIALHRLLEKLCTRLRQEEKGLRKALLKSYRIDGKIEQLEIGTNRASCNTKHLFKLFENGIAGIQPEEGIELFILEAPVVEDISSTQEQLWSGAGGLEDIQLAELLDRLAGRLGTNSIHRYLPEEHYWPERSIKAVTGLTEKATTAWRYDIPRPTQLLPKPEPIEVAAPVPDYPPMLFRYKGILHIIKKADGPERIEREWWIDEGAHRDYYCVEDEQGQRYWLFRSGHYTADKLPRWFIHGFFA